ncbi:DUF4268 domain-containing protein [Candidatus Bipolaricaulota bacterium]
MELSRLTKVELREAWPNEAADFTSWLAEEENLRLLSDEIGVDLSLVETEASVGRFALDILAEEETTGRKVVIENQLEATNHDHLGKLITYASGFDAEIVVWIVKDVRDEHKQAVDWLNDHTDDKINLFAIEMELWRIGDSPFAPKFQVISQPNDWAKAVRSAGGPSALSETKLMQREFWTQFREFASSEETGLKLRRPRPQHWFDISIGSSKANITLVVDTRNEQLRCEVYISDDKDLFATLESDRPAIESALEHDLEWMELQGKKASRIVTSRSADVSDSDAWEECFAWLLATAQEFHTVFSSRIRAL